MRFVLIHGGFHGAWCWSLLIPEVIALGHEAIAIDLPAHGKRRDEPSSVASRTAAIVEVMRPGDVLVGHSGGGYDITLAANAVPVLVGHLIYLASSLPIEGRTLIEASGGRPASEVNDGSRTELMTDESGMSRMVRPDARGWMECFDFRATWDYFYHDCNEQTARWAFDQLTPAPIEFIQEIIHLPRFWSSDLPRSFIRCTQDRSAPLAVFENAVRWLGVEALTINASHSPFLSKPRELAALMVKATATKSVGPLLPT